MPTKFKTSILIFGIIVMCLLACLATFLVLASSGVLLTEKAKVEITVQSATKVYDGTPLIANEYKIEGELAEGHKEVVVFSDSQTDAGEGESGAEVRILDEDGYDVTSMYAIKVNKGVLRVTRQALRVAIGDTDVVYSGDRIVFDDYQVEGFLAKGHKIGAAATVGVIKPGVVDSTTLKPAVYDAFGNDVTQNYDIAFAMGTVQVVPRPIVVKVRTATKVYDGKPLQAEGIEIVSGSLIAGHNISATAFQTEGGESAVITEVGRLFVRVMNGGYSIYDAKGENVSTYYKVIDNRSGYLEITPRELTVVGKSKSWEYDGKEHKFSSIAGREDTETSAEMALGLAEGHTVFIDYSALRSNTITDVGSKPCYITSENVQVFEGDTEKTRNYQITYVNGTLTVTPQNLRITIKDYTVEYNDRAIPQETLKEQLVLFDGFTKDDFELVMSEKEYKNAGVYSLSAKPYVNEHPQNDQELQDEVARRNLFKNYNLDIVPGTVTITKKAVNITVNSFSREYTGQEVTDATILSNVKCPDGFDKNNLEVEKDGQEFINAGNYLVSVKFKEGAESVKDGFESENYTLAIIPGTLTIARKKVSVRVLDYSVEYNSTVSNEALQKLIICGTNDFQASDFKITGLPSGTLNVDTYPINAEYLEDTAERREKLVNYEPTITSGILTVTKKKVKVEVTNGEAEYSQVANAYDTVLQSLLHCTDTALGETPEKMNEAITYDIKGDCVNAGTYIVSAKFRDTAKDLKNNFELDVSVGSFTVRPKEITVTMKDKDTPFSGVGILLTDISVTNDISVPDTAAGVSFKILSSTIEGTRNVGEYNYTAEMVVIDEKDVVNPNYTVRSLAGVWKITPLAVTVEIKENELISKIYDGKPIEISASKLTIKFDSQGFNSDDYSVVSVDYDKDDLVAIYGISDFSEIDPKKESYTGSLQLRNIHIQDNITGQECYNFTATGSVNVTIMKRALNISAGSITVPKGTSLAAINSAILMGGVPCTITGLAEGDTAEVSFNAQQSSGGSVVTILPQITIYNQDSEDITDYYNVTEGVGSVFFV